jgi:hypothetical protein
MHKFVARENIRHFRDRLETESDPATRSILHGLLVEEEDRLGHNSEALREIEDHIARAKGHVNRQHAVVTSIDPILIGRENLVLDGEARIEAAKLHGLDRIPCIQVGHLNEKEQRVLPLAVNRLAEKGDWDLDQLKIEFEELIIEEAPLEASGFTLDEIDHIIIADEVEAVEQGPLEPENGAVAIARAGDVFELGPHRLICGDATDPAALRLLMAGDCAARLVLTDEPYNVPIAGHVTGGAHRDFAMASGEMTRSSSWLSISLGPPAANPPEWGL